MPPYEAVFPNLYDDNDPLPSGPRLLASSLTTPTTPTERERDTTYNDFRVDSLKGICSKVEADNEDELAQLLQTSTVAAAIMEYRQNLLLKEQEDEKARLDMGEPVSRSIAGRAPHEWKISRAMSMLESRSPRFMVDALDKSSWTADDHDVRFIVRLSSQADEGPWKYLLGPHRVRQLCERAFWLMLWLRWLHKPSGGVGLEASRLRRRKEEWLSLLPMDREQQTVVASSPLQEPMSGLPTSLSPSRSPGAPCSSRQLVPQPQVAPEYANMQTSLCLSEDEAGDFEDLADVQEQDARTATFPPLGVPGPSQPSTHLKVVKSKTRNQQRGLFWLTEEAWNAFQNQQSMRLSSWGVDREHVGTCILVPEAWALANPRDLLQSFNLVDCIRDETDEQRLHLSMGDLSAKWARAAVWFNDWPRSGGDLDVLLARKDGPHPIMHGSHLCHHGLCINPNHLLYEPAQVNFSRNSCMWAARVLRTYGKQIPEKCVKHKQHPCLLQLAALTTVEAFCLQFFALGSGLGLAEGSRPNFGVPDDHPEFYATFEDRLPLKMFTTTVSLDPSNLVQPPLTIQYTTDVLEKHKIHCHFCPQIKRVWNQITAFWSHIRIQHSDRPHEDLLAEMRRVTDAYAAWADSHFYDLATNNPSTWTKMKQVWADDFTWDVVIGWRLPQDRFYQGRTSK